MRSFFTQTCILILILLGGNAQAQQHDFADVNLRFSKKNLPASQFFTEIEQQTDLSFVYTSQTIRPEKQITLPSKRISLDHALEALTEQTSVRFSVIGKQIVLRRKAEETAQNSISGVQSFNQLSTVRGYVRNAESGEVLINAQVYDAVSGQGVLTNNYGFYSLSLKPGPVQLIAAEASYKKRISNFFLGKDTSISFQLPFFALNEVKIVAEEVQKIQEETQMSSTRIPVEQIRQMPALLGEVDVVKVVQMLPGVQSGMEGSSGLYVRGGSPDQNLILLDDVPLYTIGHLGGLFSVFNADALSTVKLTKGGFPARYGGRLSSILDIRMKDGNSEKLEADASLGLLAGKLTLNGPIGKKTTFLLSGRRTWMDLPIRLIVALESGGTSNIGYQFHDVNAKIVHRFSPTDKLYLSSYSGEDAFAISTKDIFSQVNGDDLYQKIQIGLRWGNRLAALRWNHIWSPRLFSNLTATFTRFHFKTSGKTWRGPSPNYSTFDEFYFRSGVRDLGIKTDFEWYLNPGHTVRFGGGLTRHHFFPGRMRISFSLDSSRNSGEGPLLWEQDNYAWEGGLYLEDEIRVNPDFSMNLGAHLAWYHTQGQSHLSPQLRLAARYQAWKSLAFKASFVQMTQYLHLLSSSGAGIPIDLWVPATPLVPQQHSDQLAAGMAASLWENRFELSIEGYYKKMRGLIEYKEGSNFLSDARLLEGWDQQVASGGNGQAYGIEFFLQKKTGTLKGWIGYTLGWNIRQFDNLNDGKPFPYRYDRRHDIACTLSWEPGKRIQVAANWLYGTGNAVSFPSGMVGSTGGPVAGMETFRNFYAGTFGSYGIYDGGRNAARTEDFHRLDLSVSFIKHKEKGRLRTWVFSLYNAYNRKNPFSYFTSRTIESNASGQAPRERLEIRKVSLFPVLPMLTYTHSY
ncbi:MAG: TonB-dependent receptor [Bacteroidia bacterium]